MFRFLSHTHILPKTTTLLINGASTKPCTSHFLLLQTPFLIASISTTATATTSFTVSYLINSCGLTQDKAISASKKVQFNTSNRPDSILSLFTTHGFPTTHISTIIQKRPRFLLSNQDNLKLKLEFFRSIGLSGPDLAKLLATVPYILLYSLDNHIVPTYDFLKSILRTDGNVVVVLKRSTRILMESPDRDLLPKVDLLRSYGVLDSLISALLMRQPRSFLVKFDRLKEVTEKVKNMEFDPMKSGFVRAVSTLIGLGKSGFETKADIYRKWGWYEDDIQGAFRRDPLCMLLSEKKIMCNMEFFVDKMGYNPRRIAKYPVVLMYSMQKRILPRWKTLEDPSIYEGNRHLCGPPLKAKCIIADEAQLPRVYLENKDNGGGDDLINNKWFYIGVTSGFVVGFCGVCSFIFVNTRWYRRQ